jgi:RecT family
VNAIARRGATTPVPVLRLTNFDELVQFAQMAAKSVLVPPEYRGKAESIMLAVQLGSELGLSPMQSIQNIAVIGSRPTVWGDAMLALVQAHPDCLDVIETEENNTAVCTVKRRGRTPVVRRFSIEDAKTAKLWSKPGPWQQYPARMCQMRARGFALRDAFPDVLKGLITAEEARDIPAHNGPTLDAVAEPAPTAPTALAIVEPVRAVAASVAPAPVVRGEEWPDDDAIPELGDFGAHPARSMLSADEVPPSLREAINAAVPLRAPKPSVAAWLEGLAAKLALCSDRAEVEAEILSDEVCKARPHAERCRQAGAAGCPRRRAGASRRARAGLSASRRRRRL